MRNSPIHELLAERGATFEERYGVEVATTFTNFESEYQAIRQQVGLADFSFTKRLIVPEDGIDLLERWAAGGVANIRFGRVLHTFAADEQGQLESDVFIANDDERFLVIAETLVDDDQFSKILADLNKEDVEIEDVSDTTALFAIDGYKAWAVAKELFGADVLGLPYLSVETYELEGVEIRLIRAGKTSEFGYLLQVPAEQATAIWQRIEQAGQAFGLQPVGFDTHQALRLDGRFFNIHSEGAAVRDPLPLGLQWMIDFDGDDFRGKEAIMARREAGVSKKVIGVVAKDDSAEFAPGTAIVHGDQEVAEVIAVTPSPTLGHRIGLALFDIEFAFAGLTFAEAKGNPLQTISMPPFTAKSLTVKLDEM